MCNELFTQTPDQHPCHKSILCCPRADTTPRHLPPRNLCKPCTVFDELFGIACCMGTDLRQQGTCHMLHVLVFLGLNHNPAVHIGPWQPPLSPAGARPHPCIPPGQMPHRVCHPAVPHQSLQREPCCSLQPPWLSQDVRILHPGTQPRTTGARMRMEGATTGAVACQGNRNAAQWPVPRLSPAGAAALRAWRGTCADRAVSIGSVSTGLIVSQGECLLDVGLG